MGRGMQVLRQFEQRMTNVGLACDAHRYRHNVGTALEPWRGSLLP